MSAEHIVRMQRAQAWERAKGELRAVLVTYHSAVGFNTAEQFEKMRSSTENYIKHVEENGLAE